MHYFSNYLLNTEISLYLEVVSLPPLKPASLVLGSSSPPCSRRCWSYRLMSLPEIFLLKVECAILPFENHGVQNLLFLNICRTWSFVNEIVPGFLALRVTESSNSVSPAEIGWKKWFLSSPEAQDLNEEGVFSLKQVPVKEENNLKRSQTNYFRLLPEKNDLSIWIVKNLNTQNRF